MSEFGILWGEVSPEDVTLRIEEDLPPWTSDTAWFKEIRQFAEYGLAVNLDLPGGRWFEGFIVMNTPRRCVFYWPEEDWLIEADWRWLRQVWTYELDLWRRGVE